MRAAIGRENPRALARTLADRARTSRARKSTSRAPKRPPRAPQALLRRSSVKGTAEKLDFRRSRARERRSRRSGIDPGGVSASHKLSGPFTAKGLHSRAQGRASRTLGHSRAACVGVDYPHRRELGRRSSWSADVKKRRESIARGRPFGDAPWSVDSAQELGIESSP